VQKGGLEPLFRSQVRTSVRGLDVLDRIQGPVIFAANHASHLDTPLVLCSLPDAWRRKTAVAAAADYFFDTWWRAVGSSILFNTFPIDRRGGAMSQTPGEVLDDGWSLLIFPEGTRSPDGWMHNFRMGAAMLAHTHGVPIVPIAHRGTFAAMPRGRNWPAPGRRLLTIRFGAPISPEPDESVRDFAARVKGAIATLLDEETSTWWEAQRRTASGTTPDPEGPEVAQWRRLWQQTEPLQDQPEGRVFATLARIDGSRALQLKREIVQIAPFHQPQTLGVHQQRAKSLPVSGRHHNTVSISHHCIGLLTLWTTEANLKFGGLSHSAASHSNCGIVYQRPQTCQAR